MRTIDCNCPPGSRCINASRRAKAAKEVAGAVKTAEAVFQYDVESEAEMICLFDVDDLPKLVKALGEGAAVSVVIVRSKLGKAKT